MYTGNMIEELIAAVERAEARAGVEQETAELERLYLANPGELIGLEEKLVGVA
ncbi:MAG TPA: hypothetical protein VJX16_04940 [Terriglobales bacterium]|nr:hypothetical protein [Terriglobales bacterium]